jgi:hypothetical protein
MLTGKWREAILPISFMCRAHISIKPLVMSSYNFLVYVEGRFDYFRQAHGENGVKKLFETRK